MLQLITDAPEFIVRDALAFVPGVSIDYAGWDGIGAPAWAETFIVARPSDALALGLARLSAFRFESHRPRPAIADPVFAMAAARIDRGTSGDSGAPAYAR